MNLGPVGSIVLAAAGYAWAIRAMPARDRPNGWRSASFLVGLGVLGIALAGPLDGLAEVLFSAHMVQHMLLTIAAPPLLAAGQPLSVAWSALPAATRQELARRLESARSLRAVGRALIHPVTITLALNGPLLAWHVPFWHQLALAQPLLHELEHLSFLGPSVLLWLRLCEPTLQRRQHLSLEGALLTLFTTWMVCDGLGAALTLAQSPWYPAYLGAERWGLTAGTDQQIGGLVMWIGGGIFYGLTMLVIVARTVTGGLVHTRRHDRA